VVLSDARNWGAVENRNFEVPHLNEMKQTRQIHCFSTLKHNLGFCHNDTRVMNRVLKQVKHGFQGVTGSLA